MIDAAVNKLMHDPTMQLRKWAARNPDELEQATAILDELFGLSKEGEDPNSDSADQAEPDENSSPESVAKEHLA